jgi:hypothetical protein
MVEHYFRLRCQNTDRYLCVSEEGDLARGADKDRADQFAEELIEFTLLAPATAIESFFANYAALAGGV